LLYILLFTQEYSINIIGCLILKKQNARNVIDLAGKRGFTVVRGVYIGGWGWSDVFSSMNISLCSNLSSQW
jgi:hypothetical protein